LNNADSTCLSFFHRNGKPIGDFRKAWEKACTSIGLSGRIVHDLRRSGVRHLIHAGVDPHTVMEFSGHRTPSMLKRYHIIALDDLRRAAERGSAYEARERHRDGRSPNNNAQRTRRVGRFWACVVELDEC